MLRCGTLVYRNVASIPNKGSVARDQLANERTCLAFLRTGMTFVGAGIALWTAYCFAYDASVPTSVHPSRMLPAVGGFLLNGALFVTYSTRRYFKVQKALQEGMFPLAKYDLVLVFLTTFIVTCAVMAYIFEVEMNSKPNSNDVLREVLGLKRHHRHQSMKEGKEKGN